MENRRNYYRILHVQRDAPVEIIKTSYRTLMHRLKMHPDLGGDHWTATVINEAYATLTNPDKRAAYDRNLAMRASHMPSADETGSDDQGAHAEHAHKAPQSGRCHFCGTPHQLLTIERESSCNRCESPLSPAAQECHDDRTRRAMARMPKAFPLDFVTQWPARAMHRGCAVDLSTAGMRFVGDNYLPVGTLLSIDSDVVTAVARVRSCTRAAVTTAAEYETGVQFLTLRFRRTQGGFVSVTA